MISTDITGGTGSGASQILDLLANPSAYSAKLKALQDATSEHKQYVEAIAPASEIPALREQLKESLAEAKKSAADAKAEANKLKAEAKAAAKSIVEAAEKTLLEAKTAAQDMVTKAKGEVAAANALADDVKAKMSAVDIARKSVEMREQMLDVLAAELASEKAAVQAERAELRAKAEAFAKGL